MKVFISWSGERSRAVAEALREWLPNVIQTVNLWVSLADIEKGARWSTDITAQLEECSVGLICLTPENLSAPWLLFEAGALSKMVDKHMCLLKPPSAGGGSAFYLEPRTGASILVVDPRPTADAANWGLFRHV
jgi:hypothetical protein